MNEIQETLPFQGELMTCFLCEKKLQSDPAVQSGWRSVTIESYRYYVCPDHLPADDAPADDFEQAYKKILRAILDDVARLRELELARLRHRRNHRRRVN